MSKQEPLVHIKSPNFMSSPEYGKIVMKLEKKTEFGWHFQVTRHVLGWQMNIFMNIPKTHLFPKSHRQTLIVHTYTHTTRAPFPFSDWSICLFVAVVQFWCTWPSAISPLCTVDGFVFRSTEYSSWFTTLNIPFQTFEAMNI